MSRSDLLAAALPKEQPRRDDAKGFLNDILFGGDLPAKDVLAEARLIGIAEKTLQRAAQDIGVKSTRVGGIGGKGVWEWNLPEDTPGEKGDHLSDEGQVPLDHVSAESPTGHGGQLSNSCACPTLGRAQADDSQLNCPICHSRLLCLACGGHIGCRILKATRGQYE